jgi:hypothetical protein
MKRTPIQKKVRALELALRRLERAGGPISARNAREAFLSALRGLRSVVDREYPVQKKIPKRRRKPRSFLQRKRLLAEKGFVPVGTIGELEHLANAGIKTRKLAPARANEPGRETASDAIYAPGWAITIIRHKASLLRRAKASIKERRAILTEIELKKGF